MAGVAGIQIGVGHILVSPQLHPSFGGQINTQLGQQLGGNTGRAAGQSVGRSLAGAMVAGFAAVGVGRIIGKALGTGFGEVKDYQAGLAQLNAGLKSTGGAAGVTSGYLEDLASKIQKYSGQTDDSIVATESLLLTFTKIKDVAGPGNDILTQSTVIAADMAARMGGDASSSAIKLGKALQDPVLGMTALSKVGVSFDAGQKATIKQMVAAGDVMGAQKIILKELNVEFGGSAKAFGETLPGQIERAKRSFEDFSQAAVTRIVPAMYSVVGWVGPKLKTGISAGVDGIRRLWDVAEPTAKIIGGALTGAFRDVSTFVTRDLVPSLRNLWGFISPVLLPALKTIGAVVVGTVVVGFRALGGILTSVVGPALRAITGFFNSHKVAITSVAIALGGLVVGWKLYRLTQAAWFAAQTAYAVAMRVSQASITSMRASLTALNVTMRANPVLFIVTALIALGVALVYAYKHSETFRNIVQAVFRAVTAAGQWMWDNVLKPIWAAMQIAWQVLSTAIKWYWDNYAHPVINAFAAAGSWLWNTILKPVFAGISWAWAVLGNGISGVYDNVIKPVWDALNAAVRGVAAAFGWVVGAVQTAWGKLSGIFKAPINITFDVIGGLAKIVDAVTNAVGLGRPLGSLENIKHLAAGGGIRGYGGGDIVPALLEPGEFVVRKEAVRAIGVGGMEALNARHYAAGGAVMSDEQLWASVGGKPGLGGAAGDVGKWVLDKAQHWLRAGAANALDAGYKALLRPVLAVLGSTLPGRIGKGGADTAEKQIIGWIRGKERKPEDIPVTGGSGVTRWVPMVTAALDMLGLSPGLLGRAMSQLNLESGGNPRAINLTDSNAAIGQPSMGLMQTILTTFNAYAGPYASRGIWDPFANIYAGLNYAAHRYSGDPNIGLGYGHGYANGGLARGWSVVGERGPELINAGSQSAVLSNADSARLLGRRGLFDGANVTIGDQVDMDLALARYDWEQRKGTFG